MSCWVQWLPLQYTVCDSPDVPIVVSLDEVELWTLASSTLDAYDREAIRRMEEDEQKRLAARQEQIDRVIAVS